jgi:hypothetical protein
MMNWTKVDSNGLRCEAFVIWGWLRKLPLQSHVDLRQTCGCQRCVMIVNSLQFIYHCYYYYWNVWQHMQSLDFGAQFSRW